MRTQKSGNAILRGRNRRPLHGVAALIALVLFCTALTAAQTELPSREVLEGYDPVMLIQGREVPGKDALSLVHEGFKYFFASEETRAAFQSDAPRVRARVDQRVR